MLIETALYIIERSRDFTTALGQHLALTFIALGISLVLGLLLGVIATRVKLLERIIVTLGNLGRTIPSLAVLALALPFLGIGRPPTILALVFIGTLPILINTNVGINQVDSSITEAARGMGMNDLQVLLRVEIPIATAVIMAGIRTSAVLVVASATLAAFIGGGGLGDLILRGHALNKDHILLAGALPATFLAFYFEDMFGRLESWATPDGLKVGFLEGKNSSSTFWGLLSSVLLMPLVFGALLPWQEFVSGDGSTTILTGLHPEYIGFGLPLMLIGLILVMRPRKGKPGDSRAVLYIVIALAIVETVLALVTLISVVSSIPPDHFLRPNVYLQTITAIAISILTVIEIIGMLSSNDPRQVQQLASASS